MVTQECFPTIRRLRIPGRLPHPPQHGAFADIEAKHPESPWILGDPHVGFSTIILKISSLTSLLTRFLPATVRRRESHDQYCLNPAWCHRTTVSGWTMISACFQLHQTWLSSTQKNLSTGPSLDRGCVAISTAICCRKARFSSNNLRRDDPARTRSPKNNLDNRSMRPLYQDIQCANRVRNAFLSTRVSIRRDHSSVPLSSRFQCTHILARDNIQTVAGRDPVQ
jgi:hypothetical protein